MSVQGVSSALDIAISGLRAQGMKMDVLANNIANAQTTRTADGGPYLRQDIQFEAKGTLEGVLGRRISTTPGDDLPRVFQPGHPDADEDGFVTKPDINLPVEMMQMMLASRAYEANAAVMTRYQEYAETILELLR